LHNIVRFEPNPLMTAADFMDAMQGQLTLRKNAYAVIHFDKVGRPSELMPVDDPRKVTSVTDSKGRRVYKIEGYEGTFEEREILHMRSNTAEGMLGRDLIGNQSDAIGLAIALVDNASDFFRNGSRPSAVFKHPRKLHQDTYDRLKKDLGEKWSGSGNNYKTMILEEGLDYMALRHTNNDSQMIESRKEQGYEIARMFGVPPHKVGIMDKSSFNNIESQNREYAVDTILPIVTRWEMELARKLLKPRQRVQGFHFNFNMDALLRPELKARYEAYEIAIRAGIKSKDECRKTEGLPPIPDGKGAIFVESQNYKPLGQEETIGEGD
jgi:HK97 family phage portal protein